MALLGYVLSLTMVAPSPDKNLSICNSLSVSSVSMCVQEHISENRGRERGESGEEGSMNVGVKRDGWRQRPSTGL